ncbi:hypothetical protein B9Z55_027866 [Caenorhabditis nigoni]|uniref:Uncharacterized protein n=1 Tax=Caenorhabditis nigoni TaxID=1611254 RepID=A0A2G5SDP8_9PELO|nr:hypothetical protein B9Z55_027866 [Caenorhabditis nigoni]
MFMNLASEETQIVSHLPFIEVLKERAPRFTHTPPTTRAFPPLALHGPASSNAPPPRPVNSFDEALEYWNNWNGRDERIDGIDLKEYLFHTDNGRYVPQIVRRVPIDVGQLFFVKNRGRDSYRSLTDQYRNEMNRTGLLRELQFINNSQEDQAAKGMIRIRDGKEESYSIPTKTHSENPSRTVMDNRPALQMNSEDVNDNQPLPDIQPEAQLFPHNDHQDPVFSPMVYIAVVQPFMAKVVEQKKTIEELEEKN